MARGVGYLRRRQRETAALTLQIWKFSETSVSGMSISRGVGAAVGVPAALPHEGDPLVLAGVDVVKPSSTLRNFFILRSA